MGMEKEKQAILQKNPKDLESEVEKSTRNDCVKERGSLLKDLRVALENRENKKEGKPKNPTRTAIQLAEDEMRSARSRVENLDPDNGDPIPDTMDLVSCKKYMDLAIEAFLGKGKKGK